jgi:hypothetical protein
MRLCANKYEEQRVGEAVKDLTKAEHPMLEEEEKNVSLLVIDLDLVSSIHKSAIINDATDKFSSDRGAEGRLLQMCGASERFLPTGECVMGGNKYKAS